MKSSRLAFTVPMAALALSLGCFTGCSTMAKKPAMTSEQIMEEGFKGKTSLAARLSEDKGTQADKIRMVYLTQQLALNTPPKGDAANWSKLTKDLNLAAVALESNAPGALSTWKAAVNCKQCHSAHKPD